jgi:hypothetical protein
LFPDFLIQKIEVGDPISTLKAILKQYSAVIESGDLAILKQYSAVIESGDFDSLSISVIFHTQSA